MTKLQRALAQAKPFVRVGGRVVPIVGAVLLAWELYDLIQRNVVDGHNYGRQWVGFTKDLDCGVPPNTDTTQRRRSAAAVGVCLTNQALPAPDGGHSELTVPEMMTGFSILGLIYSPPAPPPPNYRYNVLEHWTPTPGETQFPSPMQDLGPRPALPPWLDPFFPPGTPEPLLPVAPPLWWVRARPEIPYNPGWEQTERGDELQVGRVELPDAPPPLIPVLRPVRRRLTVPWSDIPPPGRTPPAEKPGPKYKRRNKKDPRENEAFPPFFAPQVPPWRAPKLRERMLLRPGQVVISQQGQQIQPSTHKSRKPRKGEKERKAVVSVSRTAAGAAANAVTETLDALDAVYEALPEKIRRRARMQRHGKDPRATVKARMLWEHWDELDVQTAARKLLENHVEDWFYGQLGQRAQSGLNKAGWQKATGIEHGNTLGWTPQGYVATGNPVSQLAQFLSGLVF